MNQSSTLIMRRSFVKSEQDDLGFTDYRGNHRVTGQGDEGDLQEWIRHVGRPVRSAGVCENMQSLS